MFGLNKKRTPQCPIPADLETWIEDCFIWLINQFGEDKIKTLKPLLPTQTDFPITFNNSEQSVYDTLKIVATQMQVNADNIHLSFYDQKLLEVTGDIGIKLYGQPIDDENYSSGEYRGINNNGQYSICINQSILNEPDKLIATLAHEIAHIKLLGENKILKNDEYLTDLTTVIFGLGVFNANVAFKFYSDFDKWGYSKQGYLFQQEWGYALALLAYFKSEVSPDWIHFLTPNIKSDFIKSEQYINFKKPQLIKK